VIKLAKSCIEIEVEITWRMQIRVSPTCNVGFLIYSDRSVNLIFEVANNNGLYILELYLKNKSRQGNSYSVEFSWVPSYSQRTIQASHIVSPSSLGSNTRNLMLSQEIVDMYVLLGMSSSLRAI
jgi:hypothetical protein